MRNLPPKSSIFSLNPPHLITFVRTLDLLFLKSLFFLLNLTYLSRKLLSDLLKQHFTSLLRYLKPLLFFKMILLKRSYACLKLVILLINPVNTIRQCLHSNLQILMSLRIKKRSKSPNQSDKRISPWNFASTD